MLKIEFSQPPRLNLFHLSIVIFLTLSGCGLAMSDDDRLDRAEGAIEQGAYRAAIIDAKDVLLKEPDNIRGRLILGRASLQVGDGAAAEKEFRRAIELGTPASEVILDVAESLAQQGKYQQLIDDMQIDPSMQSDVQLRLTQLHADAYLGLNKALAARELYTAVLAIEPENVAAKLGVVSSYAIERNYIQSRSTLDEVLSAHPDSVDAWLVSGELNMRLGRHADAVGNFTKMLELASTEDETRLVILGLAGLAEAQLSLRDSDAARATVSRLVELAPDSTMALQLSARIAFLDQDWKTTQQNLQIVLQRMPGFLPAQLLMGMAHLKSGNLAQAEMFLSTVVAKSPSNVEARTLLAETRLQLNRLDLVRETLGPMLAEQSLDPRILSIAGRASLESGDIEQGISYLEQSVAADPNNGELRLQLAAAYIGAGRQAEAREVLDSIEMGTTLDDEYRRELLRAAALYRDGAVEPAIAAAQIISERWPQKGEIQNLLGYMYLYERDYENARQSFELGARKSADPVVSQRFLAAIDIIEGDLDAARVRYLDVLKQQPDTIWALVSLAGIAAQSEDQAKARELLEEARSKDTTAIEPRALLASLYLSAKDFRDAEVVAKEAITLDASNAALHNILGLATLNQRRFDEARASFQAAVDLDQENGTFRLNLAKAQNALDDIEGAQQTLQTSWDRGIADIPASGMLISLRIKEGNLDEAMRLAKQLQENNPAEQAPIAFEGEVHIAKGDLTEAIRVYDRALALGPNRNMALRAHRLIQREGSGDQFRPLLDYLDQRPLDSVARQILGQAYERDSQFEKAIQQYEVVVEAEPDNATVLNNLAWNYSQMGDSRAQATARRAYELSPKDAQIADTLGWILVQEGQVAEGVEILREAVSLSGGRPELRYHLAVGLIELGQTDEARRALDEILREDREFTSRTEAAALLDDL
jgi:putative PEP-CTERM system TPR-repeat lipoprotein